MWKTIQYTFQMKFNLDQPNLIIKKLKIVLANFSDFQISKRCCEFNGDILVISASK